MRLGILGTFVRDTLWTLADVDAGRPVEGWGGIAYSLAAASAALPPEWEIVPLTKVGRDRADEARAFAEALPGVAPAARGWWVVSEPTNRVELRYWDGATRGERLTGGVPGWSGAELVPAVAGLDALYLNFVSGMEMEVATAEALRAAFTGPIYADLHSLFLGFACSGARPLRQLAEAERWVRAFDAVQVNEDELRMLSGAASETDAEAGARRALGMGTGLVVVTRGAEGATFARRAGLPDDPRGWRAAALPGDGVDSGSVRPERPLPAGDPTGAGDVWGATFFATLLGGAPTEAAMHRANAAAGRKLGHRGTDGLRRHLAG